MPASRYVVQDCNNGSNPPEGISLHDYPPSGSVLSSWKRFVCSEHFTDDFFARSYHVGGSLKCLQSTCTGRNSLSMEEKNENNVLSCHCCALT